MQRHRLRSPRDGNWWPLRPAWSGSPGVSRLACRTGRVDRHTAVEHAAKYAGQRVQFGKPIGTLQAIQTMLAEVATNCHLLGFAVYDAASLIEQGKPFTAEAAMVKLAAARMGMESLIDTVQVEGGYSYSEEMPMARWYRDLSGTTLRESPGDFPEKLIAASLV